MLANDEAGQALANSFILYYFVTYVIQRWKLARMPILDFWSFSLIFQLKDISYQFGLISESNFQFLTRI